jgi:ABC-type nitrate/sulfonate/bicarbonate transport system substrate-binding protein
MQTIRVHRSSARNRCPAFWRLGRSFIGRAIATLLQTALVAGALMLGCERGTAGETITLVLTGTGSANDWPLMIAQSKGFFQDGDITLQIFSAQSTAAVMQQLAAGSANMGSGGLTDPLRAIDKGAKIALLRIQAQVPPYSLWAKPGIKRFDDLRKKTIIVGGAKDITRIYFDRMVMPNGLKSDDYDLIYSGTTAARFAALASGAVDAAILVPPFSFKAEGQGFSLLGRLSDYVKDLPFTGMAVHVDWARDHKPALIAFLKAYRRAVDWFYDDANRAEAIQILVTEAKAAPADAEATYDYLKSIQIFARDGTIGAKEIGPLVKALADEGDLSGTPDPARFIDQEIAQLVGQAR